MDREATQGLKGQLLFHRNEHTSAAAQNLYKHTRGRGHNSAMELEPKFDESKHHLTSFLRYNTKIQNHFS